MLKWKLNDKVVIKDMKCLGTIVGVDDENPYASLPYLVSYINGWEDNEDWFQEDDLMEILPQEEKRATLPEAKYELYPCPIDIDGYLADQTNPKFIRHKELCDQMHEIYKKKNLDYGDSFSKSIEKWGFIAAMVRMEDKFNRLTSLLGKPEAERKVKDESIIDTLLDLSAYAMMTAMEFEMREKK